MSCPKGPKIEIIQDLSPGLKISSEILEIASEPPNKALSFLGGRFGYIYIYIFFFFLFFLGRGRGSPRLQEEGGQILLIENPRRAGGFPSRG